MAPPEAAEPGHPLRTIGLLAALLAARAVSLAGQPLPHSIWTPFALVWQDVLVAAIFHAVDRGLGRPKLGWALYAAAIAYVAVNVPITRVLSSPLTWTMYRAAGGPLADAIRHYATPLNLAAMVVPVVVGVLVPAVLVRRPISLGWRALTGAALVMACGVVAVSRVDTRGLHRNAFGALVATSVPRLGAATGSADWRASPFAAQGGDDLSPLRGSMKGRNVVLVVLESTGARHLGLYGGTPDPMPNLTALAGHALVFDRGYAVYPESVKGLFATLCSRYPAFDTPPEAYANAPCASIAATLKRAGYRTALFHSGRFMYLGMTSVINGRGFDLLEDAGAIGGRVDSSFGIDDESTARRLLAWIDSADAREPFMAAYLPTAGHNPYVTNHPGPFRSDQDFWRYMNAIHEGDAALGTLVNGLRARGLADRTLFVVFGDHGEAFGEHPGNFAHTLFAYEENVRIPYVIAAPGAIRGPRRVRHVASVVDTAPTILDLLGLEPEAAHQGASLLDPDPRMALFLTDYATGWLGLVDGCWKYLYDVDSGRSHLFDICADPAERLERAPEFPDRAAAYGNRVRGWAADQKARAGRRP